MNVRLDVNLARISHLRWELELEEAAGGLKSNVHMPHYQDCELGIWLHSRGHRQIENRSLFTGLMEWHRQFHQAGEWIGTHAVMGQETPSSMSAAMGDNLSQLRQASRQIVTMLTQAELEHYGHHATFRVPSRSLGRLFLGIFRHSETLANEKRQILEVNHARLVHLSWANHLPETFKNRGRRISLEPAELCPLGVWIHGTGRVRFGHIQELAACDQAHQGFHGRAEEILNNLRRHRDQHADQAYAEVLKLSQEIIYLLSVIEYRLLGDAAIHRFSSLLT
ncbi:MAG: CZB domain-containing protein [Magnetococcales bacterium]|nr:CZB domain-containing protein [Magnetococcales bacterium]